MLLADNEASIEMNSTVHPGSSWPVYDPDVHKDSGRRDIGFVKPIFLGYNTEETGSNVYSEVNSYLGNDPMILGLGFRCSKTASRMSCFQHKTSHALVAHSEISNHHITTANSLGGYSQQELLYSCSQKHSSDVSQMKCRQTAMTHWSYYNACCPSALGAKQLINIHVPSTSVRHNPTLVQLLNAKTSLENHIKETRTSHLVTDISGISGEKTRK